MKRLVVVESPTKARTIRKFLPAGYQVEASMGHVRDLPSSAAEIPAGVKGEKWARLGVNVAEGFAPLYVVPADKRKTVKMLKDALKDADELYLATDEDREGESIGWHLLQVLNPKVPVKRMVFHEITKEAILRALDETRDLDTRLVDAQEARRIVDRLVGYSVSPVLWRKVAPKLSAGRVQSVAVRVLVEREWERLDFVSAAYTDLSATLEQGGTRFEAKMTHRGEQRLATGKDFDEKTGTLKPAAREALMMSPEDAAGLAARLKDGPWRVATVEQKKATRKAGAPFITSTLQQEANRKLGMSARRTMQTAQKLYEQGHITYMRTDSPTLSQEALDAARTAVERRYGKEFLSPAPRQFSAKVRNAQEAHEAIRPAGTQMRTRSEIGLSGDEGALYDLVWKRTVASQMADARLLQTRATVLASEGTADASTFRASGQVVEFPGFFRAYVEGRDDPSAALDDRDNPLPALAVGDRPACRSVEAETHHTRPPARYTDASLVQKLEAEGVGRPSTYASILDTIVFRGYVTRVGNQLVPTFTAFATTNLLEKNFERLVDTQFTARMEAELDEIAGGDEQTRPYLERFFNGAEGLEAQVAAGNDAIDPREISTIRHARWAPYVVRVGRYGPYAANPEDETKRGSLPPDAIPADLTREDIEALLDAGGDERVVGIHPEAGLPILLKQGPYGPYVQLGEDDELAPGTKAAKGAPKPKRASLEKGTPLDAVDLDMAVRLLILPRTVGEHPETGKPILANMGRFGPYVQHERTFASLKAGSDDDIYTVSLERALELIAQKAQKNAPLRRLGDHPVTGSPVEVFEGRYGPYVKHEKTNATIPKEIDKDAITLEEAVAIITDKAGAPAPKKAPAAKKPAAKKPAAKKPAAKKPAVKKAVAKKPTTRPAPAATPSRLRNAS
ncbi:MAG TPA: type I DNA topoisomerase [Rubricoccaceae bacterium]|jgi:DNA topoisomerase-1